MLGTAEKNQFLFLLDNYTASFITFLALIQFLFL